MAALCVDILKVAGGVGPLFAVPGEASLGRQVGEACSLAGLIRNDTRSVNEAQKQNPAPTPQSPLCILADGDHATALSLVIKVLVGHEMQLRSQPTVLEKQVGDP
jgi:hypothetical protein